MRSKIDLQSSPGGGVICTLKPLPQAACDITKSVQRGTFTNVRRKSSTNENNETHVLLTYIVLCFLFLRRGTALHPHDKEKYRSLWNRDDPFSLFAQHVGKVSIR